MIKTLLALSGALLLAAPALHAQQHRAFAVGRPTADRSFYSRSHGYGGHYGGRGRYYYYGGIPYFFPFVGLGYGYGGFYDGWYGDGYGGYGGYGPGYGGGYGYGPDGGAYEGRIANGDNGTGADRNGPPNNEGPSLPEAVQRQLSKKGYYKGSIDGQFGPASRSALSRFQHDHSLRETGRIDETTLDALGFTDHR